MSSTDPPPETKEKRPVRNPRGGRPRIQEQLGDPMLAIKARDLRIRGLSWSKIAERLGIGRSTARMLCLNSGDAQASELSSLEEDDASLGNARFRNSSETVFGSRQEGTKDAESKPDGQVPPPSDGTDENPTAGGKEYQGLPRTFRLFSMLLQRARMGASQGKPSSSKTEDRQDTGGG